VKADSVLKLKPSNSIYNENTIDFVVRRIQTSLQPLGQLFAPHRQTWNFPISASTVEQFRTSPVGATVALWLPAPWRSGSIQWAHGFAPFPVDDQQVYEARWNYSLRAWELTRKREKDANSFETAVRTTQNIIEDIQLCELVG
jgi:hypothetical protein